MSRNPEKRAHQAAYGLSLRGLEHASSLRAADLELPEWTIALRPASEQPEVPRHGAELDGDEATIPLHDDQLLIIRRPEQTATYYLNERVDHEVIAHPLLASVGSITAYWRGAIALHAGAFVDRSGLAWIVLGDRGAGKSTLLAEMHLSGAPVLADDLSVIEDGAVHRGPASIDLREPHRPDLPLVDLGEIATRRRLRLPTGDGPASAPLGGVLRLGWTVEGEAMELLPTPLAERAAAVSEARSLSLSLPDPRALLDLAALPAFTFRRPRDLTAIDASTSFLLEHLA